MLRRNSSLLNACACCALLALAASLAYARGYPTRPIHLIVPYPAGGPNDIIGRIVALRLSPTLGQPIEVENRAGAGGDIGTNLVAKARPDGYTLLSGGMGSLVMNPALEKVPYNPVTDFAPIIVVAKAPNVLVVHPSLPAKSVKQLIALARARPGALNYGSGGIGTTPDLSGALFNVLAHVSIVDVPYKGNAPALTALLGGQVQLAFLGIPPVAPYIASGKLRALAVTSAHRSRLLPRVPTIAEAGVPGYELNPWYGILAPAGTPAGIVDRLNQAIARVMHMPETIQKLKRVGAEVRTSSPGAFKALIKADLLKWRKVIRKAKIKAR